MLQPKNKDNHNDIIFTNYLKDNYFDTWASKSNNIVKKDFELMINTQCNLACKYCYYHAFGNDLYPKSIDESKIMENIDKILSYWSKNNMCPKFNIFSGEPFEQKITFSILYKLLDFYSQNKIQPNTVDIINIPTNFSFINNEKKLKTVKEIIEKAKKSNVIFSLSCSIDGKYCDKNRPYKSGYIRDDAWYNKVFEFCKEYDYGFHPMVYFDEIENWEKNFLWFEDMSKKYNLPNNYLYLLEVRNIGWDKKSIKHLYKFYNFVTKYILNKYNDTPIIDLINKHWEYNVLSTFISDNPNRSLSCGYELSLAVRMADMKIFPCHRLQYPQFEAAQLHFDNNDLLVESKNIEMYIASNHIKSSKYPVCEKCDINKICYGGCLGSQYETMKDPFISIPNVCAMEHAKIKAIVDGIKECKKLDEFYDILNKQQLKQIKILIGE